MALMCTLGMIEATVTALFCERGFSGWEFEGDVKMLALIFGGKLGDEEQIADENAEDVEAALEGVEEDDEDVEAAPKGVAKDEDSVAKDV
ncbi:unnamed protein product [Arabidopsis halleri]